MIRVRPVYLAAVAGLALALGSAWVLSEHHAAEKPLFKPVSNPYADGIYANGMIESLQPQGIDLALNPEVSGKVARVLVREGDHVRAGQPLLQLDDSIQRPNAEQLDAAAAAAAGTLAELHAQPRPETLAVSEAQTENAAATLRNAADARAKQERAFALDPRSVSRDALDNARNTEAIAATAYKVARRNTDLVRAGAWHFDIANQEATARAASKAAQAAHATLDKFTLRAPADGVVMAIAATVGSTVSTGGVYDPRTQATVPVITYGPATGGRLQVRAYVDEILLPHLPIGPDGKGQVKAVMSLRGSDVHIPLHFERVQPYVSPKISLSDQRQERVDLRVLPVIFSFTPPKGMTVYPGQLVDIYISGDGK
ncbi:hypothetical protein Y88_1066 [Novosphingobium nitrogenifigens DSM 19370]|uniref:Multidrug resistance protein MdtA-like barrel-sandwich hybrid domain-containing protein n=1 Tax=Novosphingobium nitrogenifigens DSM 19370 TaxID=983920 RepID=F1Z8M1_9SPHN|nr:biotin/lipoyl-binding protein [Novosphingobium nitrogenifigens]EGD59004.1 hypothetical protein Y88_1066 [Novosphingobium nitrogenifigens DSM 19370]